MHHLNFKKNIVVLGKIHKIVKSLKKKLIMIKLIRFYTIFDLNLIFYKYFMKFIYFSNFEFFEA